MYVLSPTPHLGHLINHATRYHFFSLSSLKLDKSVCNLRPLWSSCLLRLHASIRLQCFHLPYLSFADYLYKAVFHRICGFLLPQLALLPLRVFLDQSGLLLTGVLLY
jgi:hypothetical protein